MELSKLRGEVAKIPSLEQQIKSLTTSNGNLMKEKQELCQLVSSLRDQLNEMEDEKTSAKHDEALMREKLGFVVKEKEILNQKIKNLEGLYQSELGEIQHAEDVMQQLKKTQLEMEYLKKTEKAMKREKEELKAILAGLKDHINEIETQRDHFEDAHDKLQAELQRMNERHSNLVELHHHNENANGNAKQEIEAMRDRLDAVAREKEALEQENIDLQERLDENIDKLYAMESKRNSVDSSKVRSDRALTSAEVTQSLKKFLRCCGVILKLSLGTSGVSLQMKILSKSCITQSSINRGMPRPAS